MNDNIMRKVWYQYKFFWRRGDNDGDNSPQDRDDGTIDLLYNTLTKIVKDKLKNIWALMSFIECANLLIERKRWPKEMNIKNEAKTRIFYYIGRLLWKRLKLNIKHGSRPQHDMTRDPYKAFGACYAHLLGMEDGKYDTTLRIVFESVTIPWYLYRKHTWRWRKRLIKDNRKHYNKRMSYFEARAIVDYFEKIYEDDFYKDK